MSFHYMFSFFSEKNVFFFCVAANGMHVDDKRIVNEKRMLTDFIDVLPIFDAMEFTDSAL